MEVLERERNIECVMEEGADYQFCHRPTVATSLFPQGLWPQNPKESVPGWSKFDVRNRCIQADAADAQHRFPFLAPLLSPICLHCWLLTTHSCPRLWRFALSCGCYFTQEVIHLPPSRGGQNIGDTTDWFLPQGGPSLWYNLCFRLPSHPCHVLAKARHYMRTHLC